MQQKITMLIGYARVSKQQQDTTVQVQELTRAGAERINQEHASGGRWDRPELHRLLDQLNSKGAGFRSLTEQIDITTPAGRMMMQMVGAFAEFEREMIRRRTNAGLAVARSEGRGGGRRPKLSPQQQAELVRGVQEERYSMAKAARLFQVDPATVSRLMARQRTGPSGEVTG